jgi:RHS repeat-associated protein
MDHGDRNNKLENTASGNAGQKNGLVTAPSISLPKGGGAIRGMGEKFSANPVTGTGSMSVVIATSPGRSGFGPQLSLSYDSGSGNGPFGLGWNLSLPAITRKTDKGLPKYLDAEESDVFILSGAEDLVPVLVDKGGGTWEREKIPSRIIDGQTYQIRRYRPRIEGLFARIERWTNQNNPSDIFWRSISKDNITTWYGKSVQSRIADPADESRIFSWLICESYDDKGNVIVYGYKNENSDQIDSSHAHEQNRSDLNRSANRYLKYIRYGNRIPYFPKLQENQSWPSPPGAMTIDGSQDWYFEVVFDYGEHNLDAPRPNDMDSWILRRDPFSTYRAGFEVRHYRLCRRVLMFHHFPEELGTSDYLVRSTDFEYSENTVASFITRISQSGYVRHPDSSESTRYLKKSLPPLEFEYSLIPTDVEFVELKIQTVDAESLENLPGGLDGSRYQWVDLDGEGVSGILTEQGGEWYYKRNISPITPSSANHEPPPARFESLESIAKVPVHRGLGAGRQQLLDLAGNGQLDLVEFDEPMPGFYKRTDDKGWTPFRPFTSLPNLNWQDHNLRFVDLTGDGRADALITEDQVLTWYPSLAESGFGPATKLRQALDEEKGPRLVFADAAQSIYLADLSGDGLTDLVRIRNGEVCYWPNLGYGRFGAKVCMDHAPWFDAPDLFEQKRIRLADIDGTGVSDIVYLHRNGAQIYFNQSGNGWSDAVTLPQFPPIDELSSVQVLDFLGNGTACLLWSSPLPGYTGRCLRYIDLMNGQKPHLLVKTKNNLGAETTIRYAPSTQFYLQDKYAGKPWITRLPFPVHCVEKVTVKDQWRKTEFSTSYSYHHGYFDGIEREFRGFGRVEQVDVENYGTFSTGNAASPYITDDKSLYQPPVKTITWFHTGAAIQRDKILKQFENEYFPRWIENASTGTNVLGNFSEKALPEPDLEGQGLSAEEWREALRACKGMVLRQESYELDVDDLHAEQPKHTPVRIYSTATHNCHIQFLQPQASNRHAVFLVTESEAITYHYELDLRPASLQPDPRIAHSLNLKTDLYGNVLQAVAVAYPRRLAFEDADLEPADIARIREVQQEMHLAYTENRYTDDAIDSDSYRLRVPCEVLTYELTGIRPEDNDDRLSTDPRDNLYFSIDELRRFQLSPEHQSTGEPVTEIAYQQLPNRSTPQKRCVEQVRTLFFNDELNASRPFRHLGAHGLLYETYTLALTDTLLGNILADKLTPDVQGKLNNASISGYLSGSDLANRFEGLDTAGQYWRRSGIAGFATDAAAHFFLPERYTDPFGNTTTLEYDPRDLFVRSSLDALGNMTQVAQFDFRVLAPREMQDINGNLSEVFFDALGLPTAMAVKGKGTEGDNLNGFDHALANPDLDALNAFFNAESFNEAQAQTWLSNASSRHVYHFGEIRNLDGTIAWGAQPACACGIMREKHVSQLTENETSPLQCAFEYTDGLGSVLVKKVQAEPAREGDPLRWIASGKTVLNNKGKPVKQYEPYFSPSDYRFETPTEEGVTPIIYYDAAGRTVRTEAPDGSYSRVEFSPWHVAAYDRNDTVLEPGNAWYARMSSAIASDAERRAAALTAKHAGTPTTTILDSLGRDVIAIAHNRVPDNAPTWANVPLLERPWLDERYVTFTKPDAEGKPLWIRDARGNLVMQYIAPVKPTRAADEPDTGNPESVPANAVPCYDIAGNLLFQHSMDGGDRWMLNDAAGKPMLAWDFNERQTDSGTIAEQRLYFTEYDALHRPIHHWLSINDEAQLLIERFEYIDTQGFSTPAELAIPRANNLLGQLVRHYDASGLIETVRRDFKGNLLEAHKRLASAYTAPVIDWSPGSPTSGLETETWAKITEYDALNRMARQYNWHKVMDNSRVAVYEPRYNERGLLKGEDLYIRATKTPNGYDGGQRTTAIMNIAYDAKGQKQRIAYGNGTTTRYDYDPQTFRLRQLLTTRLAFAEPSPDFHSTLASLNVLQQLSYTYDPIGNITEIYDEAYEPVFFANQEVEPRSRYVYDALYRLIEASGREHANLIGAPGQFQNTPDHSAPFPIPGPGALRNYTQRYRYDPVGNITEMNHIADAPLNGGPSGSWTRRYEYASDSNRLLRTWTGSSDTNAVVYRYDTHGSMLNLANVPEEYRLRWDYRDMIHATNLGGGGWAYYQYEAGKERNRKVITSRDGTKQWERLYLGGMEVYRRYVAGAVVDEIETHHLFVGEQRVLIVEDVLATRDANLGVGARFRYQYGNHLGSACVELDEAAAVITYEEYHPYGTTAYQAGRSAGEVSLKRYRYTGKERDSETGLNYHSARYYLPWLGRWGSCDPAGILDWVNLYQFVKANPIVHLDKSGLQHTPSSGAGWSIEVDTLIGLGQGFLDIPRGMVRTWSDPGGVIGGMHQEYQRVGGGARGAFVLANHFNPFYWPVLSAVEMGEAILHEDAQAAGRAAAHFITGVVAARAPIVSAAASIESRVARMSGGSGGVPPQQVSLTSPPHTPTPPQPRALLPAPPQPRALLLPRNPQPREPFLIVHDRIIPTHEIVTRPITAPRVGRSHTSYRGIGPQHREWARQVAARHGVTGKIDVAHVAPLVFTPPGVRVLVRPQTRNPNRSEGHGIEHAAEERRNWNEAHPSGPQMYVRPQLPRSTRHPSESE